MDDENINTFLVIDDDPSVVQNLTDFIRKNFMNSIVYSAGDGNNGWNLVEKHKPSIILSSISIPGISGAKIYKKLRQIPELTSIYFIAMIPDVDKLNRLKILEEGADDFINKPFSLDELYAKLFVAIRFCYLRKKRNEENDLLRELAAELESDINDILMCSITFIRQRIAYAPALLKEVAQASVYIAKALLKADDFDYFDIKAAAYLVYTGKMFLPDELVEEPIMLDGQVTHELMYRIPVESKEILSKIKRFKDIMPIVYHVYENYDGTGFPERLKTWQIPFASRIIRACLDYFETLQFTNMSPMQIITNMQNHSKRLYDSRVITMLEQYLAANKAWKTGINERPIKLQDLKDDMLVTRDVITNNGLKLIPAGTKLTTERISKIISHNSSDPILGNIFIQIIENK